MTVDKLFGKETKSRKSRSIKFRVIKPVFETLHVREDITRYISPLERYTSPEQIFETFRFLNRETKEHFISLFLDGKNRILALEVVSIGSLSQAIVHPREVFKTALLSSAAAIILLHNHPTGDPSPSAEDLSISKRLREAGELLGIKVLDHIIVGETYLSFVSQGLL